MDLLRSASPATRRYLLGFDLRRKPHLEADVLVIGSGVAGLTAALSAAEAGAEVLLLTKGPPHESNTRYAQGGVAAVLGEPERSPGDTVEAHLADTIAAGAGLCDSAATQAILDGADEAIAFLRRHGCRFDADEDGTVALTREGGHSHRRILHSRGDSTGAEVARALQEAVLAQPLITLRETGFALDLLTDQGRVVGALYQRRGEIYGALAGATVLATGGCGIVWRETTNPAIATGDGLAMAYRAGATVADCEFMQFHPTTLYLAGGARLLITEAMRGEGALLKNNRGEPFMERYHDQGDLAPRDVVSRAIVEEIRRTQFAHVWLDATHLGDSFLRERFPTIHRTLAGFGIDIAKDWIPVHPSAHYHCGGVVANADGRTDLPGLFACGEVACTGIHGANRLASNSILEGLVCGHLSGRSAATEGGFPGRIRIDHPHYPPASDHLDVGDLVRSLRSTMWRSVGLERNAADLASSERALAFWAQHQARGAMESERGWELQNMLLVGTLVTAAARARTASVGTHCRSDSTGPIDPRHIAFQRPEGLT